ncbi:hypothetical protein [uncultured Duodenibacillus sp.]|uniref:hypothetical protein n=1 Tax=uncultured Duodenibacillus sp. TaxID=1980699 RepID=UPI00258F7ED7|nr:hypothetical protein [uncultured Duodenibacillus sp.]
MKNAVMTDAVRHRCPGRERGSILIFALTVLFFFSGMAVFLKTMLDSQVFIESRDAEYAVEADLLLSSGFEAYGMIFTEAFPKTATSDTPEKRAADALNSIGKVAVKNFGSSSSSSVPLGVFYTNKKDLSEKDVVITQDGMGWRIKTKNDLTWHLELADGTKLTRKAPVNLYIHRPAACL